jgi:putative endonuclease
MKNKKAAYDFGILAETLSVLYLRLKLYSIIERRYKTYAGEVDIIAKRAKSIVFIEVKARKNSKDTHEVLSRRQQIRITRAAQVFLSNNKKFGASNIRFDLILFTPKFIKHIKNAWESEY